MADIAVSDRGYRQLDPAAVVRYARAFLPGAAEAQDAGAGNVNCVYRVLDHDGGSVIVKQALPYLKIVGDSWPLALDRARIEAESLRIANRVAPGLTPEILHFDPELAVVVMQDMAGYEVWRTALMGQRRYPAAAASVGEYCARMFIGTSDLGMPPADRKRLAARFVNPDLCGITEELVFTAPFMNAASNNIDAHLRQDAERLWADRKLRERVGVIRFHYRTSSQSLIHADLHTGSVMVAGAGACVIDTEFSFMGPIAYDLGVLIGNLLISYLAHRAQGHDAFASTLWPAAKDFWEAFTTTLSALWPEEELWQDIFLNQALDAAGRYAGTKLVRRIIGLAHAPDIDDIPDDTQRQRAQRDAIWGGRALILAPRIDSLEALWATATTT
jgi:5-methylthioribose kinase